MSAVGRHRENIRVVAVWCPDWPAIAAARCEGIGVEEPLAVLSGGMVLACNAPARAAGVRRGVRRRDAQFRCPSLLVRDVGPGRDSAEFEPVARALDAVVAGTELLRPGLVVLSAPGALRYYGGVEELVEVLVGAVAEVDVECLVGLADELPTAVLAAREGACLEPGGDAAYLAPLSLSMLAAEQALLAGPELDELIDLLRRLGVHTLGAFAELSPRDVATRFGSFGAAAQRICRGERWRLPSVSSPPPGLEVVERCDPPLDRVDQAAFVGRRCAVRMHGMLAAAGMACIRLAVVAELEDGRRVRRVWRCAEPLSADATADRVRWQLDGWITGAGAAAGAAGGAVGGGDEEERPGAAIVSLLLEPLEVVPAGELQEGLWGSSGLVESRARRALQRVQGLLGTESVRVAAAIGGRAPSRRVGTTAYGDAFDAPPADVAWPGQITGPAPSVVEPPSSYRLLIDIGGERRLVPLGSGLGVLDARGIEVAPGPRGLLTARPEGLRIGSYRLDLSGWSAPWPEDTEWWSGAGALRLRMQVAPVGAAALLLSAEAGSAVWNVEGVYE
ncbi:DNA polymerase Y family protein [Dietzia sp.]|uniref:DNA polymerase Y family protein n=1 Tax=Dietzia sp. TaxID=1871616 RepID=UPI002FDB29AA